MIVIKENVEINVLLEFVSNIKGCLQKETELVEEEEVEEVEEPELEVETRFMFNHLNNISTA